MIGPYPIDGNMSNISGGVQAVMVNMIKGLSRFKDLDIHIVTASFFVDKGVDFSSDGINVHVVPLDRRFGNITLYSNTRKRLCKKINDLRPDLVHAHMFGYYTLAALDSAHKKVIVSTHGMSDGNWGVSYNMVERTRRYLQDYIYIQCVKKTENIITNNLFARKALARFGKKRMYELNNPISDVFFGIDNNAEESGRILFAGNVCEAKGIMTILQALNIMKKRFEKIKFMIAGNTVDRDFYYRATRFIKENGLGRFVDFLGHLDDNKLKEEYRRASIFIFPSQEDVAPLAVLQAMAAGKAIVASRVGGIPYIIDDGINGFLIEKQDHHALAEKIDLFIKDDNLRRMLGFNAQKKISDDYRINTVADRLYKIYQDIWRG